MKAKIRFPIFSALGLLYPVRGYFQISAHTSDPPEIVGYVIGQLAYALLVATILTGTFRIFGIQKRGNLFAITLCCFAWSFLVTNHGSVAIHWALTSAFFVSAIVWMAKLSNRKELTKSDFDLIRSDPELSKKVLESAAARAGARIQLLSASPNESPETQAHILLGHYVRLHDQVFNTKPFRSLPIPGLFKKIDFKTISLDAGILWRNLTNLRESLVGIPNTYTLAEYLDALRDAVKQLGSLTSKLAAKAEGKDYDLSAYNSDLESYEESRARYVELGAALNKQVS